MALPSGTRAATTEESQPTDTMDIQLLGAFRVSLNGRAIEGSAFARRKATSLIKLLALQPGHHLHRDQVVEYLWPELGVGSAGTQFYKAIHHVRQAFATVPLTSALDDLLYLRGEVIGLTAPGGVTTDIDIFEDTARQALAINDLDRIRQAIDLYRGDLLPTDLYEEWSILRRDALRETLVDLMMELGELLLATGAFSEAADALRQVIARDATREEAHRALMLAYARQGNRSRALRQFQTCLDALQHDVGVDVSDETTRLYEDIRDNRVQRMEARRHNALAELAVLPPFIGRAPEQDTIRHYLDRLARGQGAVVGIRGQAGIGKTRLAQEILRSAWQRRWHVMSGAAREHEGQIPYAPFVEALRHAIQVDPSDAHLIPAELAQAIPELPPTVEPAQVPDRLAAQHALFAGVLRFLMSRAANAPVVLVLDDLQAMDDGSLKLFHHLARETASQPFLLVGCWREEEPKHAPQLDGVIDSLTRHGLLNCMTLTPLSEPEHRTLIEQSLGGGRVDPMLAAQIYSASEGNVLFALEIATQLVADRAILESHGIWRLTSELTETDQAFVPAIPRSLKSLAAHRIEMLSPDATRLIQSAAVIGRDVPLVTLQRMLGPHVGFLDLLDEALATGLLVETGLDVRFAHSLMRAVVYDEMSSARRRQFHATAATVMEDLHAHDGATVPVESIAYHYRRAGNSGQAIRYLIQAGDRAEAVYDHDSALACLREALELLPIHAGSDTENLFVTLHERIGDVHRATGNIGESLGAYRLALDATSNDAAVTDQERRHALHHKVTLNAILMADMPLATKYLEQTRALVDDRPITRARHLILESLYHWHVLAFDASIEYGLQALNIAEEIGAMTEASQACEMLAIAYMPLGNWKESLKYELRRQIPDWSPDIVVAIDAHLCLYQYKLHNEESLSQVREFIESLAEQATTIGNLRCLAVCHFVLGYLAMLQGHPEIAAESIAQAVDLHDRIGSPAGVAYSVAQQAGLLVAAGVHDSVPHLIQEGIATAQQAAIRDHCLTQLYSVGIRNLIEAGDTVAAEKLVGAALEHNASSAPCAVCQVELYASLAAYHVATGASAVALEYVEQGLQLAVHAQNGPGRGRLLYLSGQAYAASGSVTVAAGCFDEAATIFRQAGDSYDLARTLHARATLDSDSEMETLALRAEANQILDRYHAAAVSAAIPDGKR